MQIPAIFEDFGMLAAEAISKMLKLVAEFNRFEAHHDFDDRRFMVNMRHYGHNSRKRQMLRAIDIAECNRKKGLS